MAAARSVALLLLSQLPRRLTYLHATLLYLLTVSFLGALAIYGIEAQRGAPVEFFPTWFNAVSAVTVTGLVAQDLSLVSQGSRVVMFFLILLGGAVFCSASMPLLRWWHVRAALAAKLKEAGAAVEGGVPLSVDRKIWAGRVLLRNSLAAGACLLLAYWACVQLAAFAVLAIYTARDPGVRAFLAARGVDPVWFSGFHAVSSFNNAGFTLFTDNLTGLKEDHCVLLTLSVAMMLGNVASPLALRGLLRLLHAAFPRDVRFAFLLRHPRVVFFNVFRAATTRELLGWLCLFTALQFVSFLSTDYNRPYLAALPGTSRALIALFSSVSPRTAGFNVVNMIDTAPSQQLLCAIMMYLAATPLLVALKGGQGAAAAPPGKKNDPEGGSGRGRRAAALEEGSGRGRRAVALEEGSGRGRRAAELAGMAQPQQQQQQLQVAAAPPPPLAALAPPLSPSSPRKQQLVEAGGLPALSEDDVAPHEDAVEVQLLQLVPSSAAMDPQAPSLSGASVLRVVAGEVPLLLAALLLICYSDDDLMGGPNVPIHRSIFGVAYEICSAYGTVGLTLEASNLTLIAYFSTFSQLVIIAVMFAGRLRGLPLNSDPAAQLYGEWGAEFSPLALRGVDSRDSPDAAGGAEGEAPLGAGMGALAQGRAASQLSLNEHAFTVMQKQLMKHRGALPLRGLFAKPSGSPGGAGTSGLFSSSPGGAGTSGLFAKPSSSPGGAGMSGGP